MNEDIYLTSCGNDIKVVSLYSFEIVNSFAPHFNWTDTLSWNCDNTLISSTGNSECVKIHSNILNNIITNELGSKTVLHSLAKFSHSSPTLLATSGKDKMVILWDVANCSPFQAFRSLNSDPKCLSFTKNDTNLCVGCGDNEYQGKSTIAIFDLTKVANSRAMTIIQLPNNNKNGGVTKIDVSNFCNNTLACCTTNGNLYLIDMETAKATQLNHEPHSKMIDLAFSHVNNLLMMGAHTNGYLSFYDVKENKSVRTINCDEHLTCIEQSKNGQYLVVGTEKGKILFYDMRNISKPLNILKAHPSRVNCISIENKSIKINYMIKNEDTISENINQDEISLDGMLSSIQQLDEYEPSLMESNFTINSKVSTIRSGEKVLKKFTSLYSRKSEDIYKSDKLHWKSSNESMTSNRNNRESLNKKSSINDSIISNASTLSDKCINTNNHQYDNQNCFSKLENSIKNTISNTILHLKDDIHADIRLLQVDMIGYLKKFKVSNNRLEELERQVLALKEENKQLKLKLEKLSL